MLTYRMNNQIDALVREMNSLMIVAGMTTGVADTTTAEADMTIIAVMT